MLVAALFVPALFVFAASLWLFWEWRSGALAPPADLPAPRVRARFEPAPRYPSVNSIADRPFAPRLPLE